MQLGDWSKYFSGLPRLDALIGRITKPDTKPVFMVGSALSAPGKAGEPGVPGVQGMISLIENRYLSDQSERQAFRAKLAQARTDGASMYGAAFAVIRDWQGQDAVNTVIRDAVRDARKPDARRLDDDASLEQDLEGWALPRGTRALGELLARFPEEYPGPTLTTNFDPLLWIAVKQAGGDPHRTVLDGDGSLRSDAEINSGEQQIVYLHGYWRNSDTHHLGIELTAPRPRLDASLARLLDRRLVVVTGYSGWGDAFMKAMSALLEDSGAKPDIAWAVLDENPGELFSNHTALLDHFDQWRYRGRFNLYAGVNAHDLFEQVLSKVDIESQRAENSPSSPASAVQESRPAVGAQSIQRHQISGGAGNPPGPPRGKQLPRAAAATEWRRAADLFDGFIKEFGHGVQEDPSGDYDGNTRLKLKLVDVCRELDVLADAKLAACNDEEFVVKMRMPRNAAKYWMAELKIVLDRRMNAEAELGQLAETLKQIRNLIQKWIKDQDGNSVRPGNHG